LLDILLISDIHSSGIMRLFTGCLLSTVWRALSDHIFKGVTCPFLFGHLIFEDMSDEEGHLTLADVATTGSRNVGQLRH